MFGSGNNHYLNKLYNDLVTNSPKIISMNIPSDIGQKAVYKRMDRLKEKIKKIF